MLLTEVAGDLCHQQRIVLRDLLDNPYTTIDRLEVHLYVYDRTDGGPLSARETPTKLVWEIRRKLWPGWQITSPRDGEYQLTKGA